MNRKHKRTNRIASLAMALALICLWAGTANAQAITVWMNCTGVAATDTAELAAIKVAYSTTKTFTVKLPNAPDVSKRCTFNTETVTSNLTIDNTDGSGFATVTGQTFTIAGSIVNPLGKQIFFNALSGQGTVSLSGDNPPGPVTPQWWGAVALGLTDCSPATQAAINSGARRIYAPGGGYGFARPVTITSNNFVLEGDSRVYTDFFPLSTDIHVGSGPNALFINAQNITNCIIEKIRFTSPVAFSGWAIWAEDGVQGGQALFSSTIQDCWISMGTASLGFFHGGFQGSNFTQNEIENTAVVFDLKGAGLSENSFTNNRLSFGVGSFIKSTDSASANMIVNGLQVQAHRQGLIFDLKDCAGWQIDGVGFGHDAGGSVEGGLAQFDTCTKVIFSNFTAVRTSGNMSGILLKDSEAKISHGYIKGVNGTAANRHPILIQGTANDIDLEDVTVDTTTGAAPSQVYFDTAAGGNIRFAHCKFTKGFSRIFDGVTAGGMTANVEIRENTLINGQYNAGASTVRQIEIDTSGRLWIINNTIGVDDVLATPLANFAFNGSGDLRVEGNTYIGTASVPVFSGGSAQFISGPFVQMEGASLTVSTNTIAPTASIHQIGAGLIKTITVPAGFVSGSIYLVPTAAFTYDATGNVLGTGTAVVGRTMIATYSSSTGKWSMNY